MTVPPAGFPPLPAHLRPLPARVFLPSGDFSPGLPFAEVSGLRPLELDLYLPPGDVPAPLVIFLHGGGWRVGSRHSIGPHPADFSMFMERGLAVASVDYRLSGEAVWPAQLDDVRLAMRRLRGRAAELGIDADRIGA